MGLEGLTPTPVNFTIFYHYYNGQLPKLKASIDNIVSSNSGFSEELCQTLYDTYFGETQERRYATAVQSEIRRALAALSSLVDAAGRGAESYGNALEEFNGQLATETGLGSLREAIDTIGELTQTMKLQNERLSQELSDATKNMDSLRGDLENVRKDPLSDRWTGLGNRRFFDIELRTALAEADGSGQPLSLIMADIDKFQALNDSFGQETGNEVLKFVARLLRDTAKRRDTPCRYGGEEFAVILPRTTLKDGLRLAEQMRLSMTGKRFVRRSTGTEIGAVTLSFGVAMWRPGELAADLVARADAALLAAKRMGRNCVCAETANEPAPGVVGLQLAAASTASAASAGPVSR